MDGRHRGGGDAARARRLGARLAHRRRASRAAGRGRRARAAETHGSAIELARRPARRPAGAAAEELETCASGSTRDLAPLGLRAGVAGTHPFAQWTDVQVSGGPRYQSIYDSMRELARREPTFALHVHVAVPGAEAAVRRSPPAARAPAGAPRPVRELALLAGPRHGLASARTPVFSTFPRTGIPRPFASYAEYVEAVDVLVRCERDPRADVPVVGRAPATALRHARGAGDGRPDAGRPTPPRSPRSSSALVRLEADGGLREPAPRRSPWRCSTRTASSPRATGRGPMLIDVDGDSPDPDGRHAGGAARRVRPACTRPRLRGGARRRPPDSLDDPGDERQRRRGGRGARRSGRRRARHGGRGPWPPTSPARARRRRACRARASSGSAAQAPPVAGGSGVEGADSGAVQRRRLGGRRRRRAGIRRAPGRLAASRRGVRRGLRGRLPPAGRGPAGRRLRRDGLRRGALPRRGRRAGGVARLRRGALPRRRRRAGGVARLRRGTLPRRRRRLAAPVARFAGAVGAGPGPYAGGGPAPRAARAPAPARLRQRSRRAGAAQAPGELMPAPTAFRPSATAVPRSFCGVSGIPAPCPARPLPTPSPRAADRLPRDRLGPAGLRRRPAGGAVGRGGSGRRANGSGGRCCPHCIVARRPERDGVGTPTLVRARAGWRATNPRRSACRSASASRSPSGPRCRSGSPRRP